MKSSKIKSPHERLLGPVRSRCAALLGAIVVGTAGLRAADIEPRAYSNIPAGLNFLIAGYAYTEGNVTFDPSIPIQNGKLTINSSIFAYARSLDLWGTSGKLDVIIPEVWLNGTAQFQGRLKTRSVFGLADPLFRFYVNLFGAPSLSLKEFPKYQQDTIIGASLAVSVPLGQYDSQKLVNIGTNRWFFKPEIGISKVLGPLTLEVAGGVYFFTNNYQPFRGKELAEAPIYAIQAHLIHNFARGVWAALDMNYYAGGQTTLDGVKSDNSEANWRIGGTLTLPLSRSMAIKFYGSTSVYSRTQSYFNLIGSYVQYSWGGGL